MDPEVANLQQSLMQAEKRLNHKMATPDSEDNTHMFTQNLGLDEDVVAAQQNIALVEKAHKMKTPTMDMEGSWEVPGF